MHERDQGRQHLVNAEANDSVRLPAADFHDRPWLRGDARQPFGESLGRVGVAIFIEVFHGDSSGSICRRYSKTRLASASAMMLKTMPT
jgi:hypothetical protein